MEATNEAVPEKPLQWVVQLTCKDTDVNPSSGAGNVLALVEMYIPVPTKMTDYGMTYASAVLNDSRFKGFSLARTLRGDQLEKLQNGNMVKVTKFVKIENLNPLQIKARCQSLWEAECELLSRELEARYQYAGMAGWEK